MVCNRNGVRNLESYKQVKLPLISHKKAPTFMLGLSRLFMKAQRRLIAELAYFRAYLTRRLSESIEVQR